VFLKPLLAYARRNNVALDASRQALRFLVTILSCVYGTRGFKISKAQRLLAGPTHYDSIAGLLAAICIDKTPRLKVESLSIDLVEIQWLALPKLTGGPMGTQDRCKSFLATTLLAVACGCSHTPAERVSVTPSLRPVDAARPLVIFSQVQGKACGRDAVLGAIRDMKRLSGIDGYVEVVVIATGTGNQLCAQATAYPFRYGTKTDLPVVRAGDERTQAVVIPARSEPSSSTPTADSNGSTTSPGSAFDCADACQRLAALIESSPIKTALAKARCQQRCQQPDTTFQKCISAAHDASTAKMCQPP